MVAIPFSRWGATPFVLSPTPFPAANMEDLASEHNGLPEVPPQRPHAFELALIWRQELENHPTLSQAKIAAREGLSRARVTQIMDLLELPAYIHNYLLHRAAALETPNIPERRLRVLVRCGDKTTQVRYWRKLLQELGGSQAM